MELYSSSGITLAMELYSSSGITLAMELYSGKQFWKMITTFSYRYDVMQGLRPGNEQSLK
jgi:hypothetical protein